MTPPNVSNYANPMDGLDGVESLLVRPTNSPNESTSHEFREHWIHWMI